MAISHLCLQCGFDLARTRAVIDPHYGLALIFCPRCATAGVRRRHPVERRWRQVQRLTRVLATLLAQLFFLALFLSLISTVAAEFADNLARRDFDRVDSTVLVYAFFALPIALGTWLTAGLPHWSRLAAWLVFAALIAFITACDLILWPAFVRTGILNHVVQAPLDLAEWAWRLAVLCIIMIAALPGIVFGRAVRTFMSLARSRRWRARRRRLRLRGVTE